MLDRLQSPLSLMGRLLLALLFLPAGKAYVQQLMLFKNVAVVGGLLTLAAWGAGGWSADARR